MLSPSHLQFRLMTPEAQHAALHRLALRGWDAKTISERTGVAESEVARILGMRDAARSSLWRDRGVMAAGRSA